VFRGNNHLLSHKICRVKTNTKMSNHDVNINTSSNVLKINNDEGDDRKIKKNLWSLNVAWLSDEEDGGKNKEKFSKELKV
jgi:hypothetical protein